MYGSPILLCSLLKKADGGMPCNFLFLLNHLTNRKSFSVCSSEDKSILSAMCYIKKDNTIIIGSTGVSQNKSSSLWVQTDMVKMPNILPSVLQFAMTKYPPSGMTGSIPAFFNMVQI